MTGEHEAAFLVERGSIYSQAVGLARLSLLDGDPEKALGYLNDAVDDVHERWWKAGLADGHTEQALERFLGPRDAKARRS